MAHPAWSQLTIEDGRALKAAHAVEIYNHGCAVETDRGEGFYLLDQLLNEGARLNAIATDDAHFRHGDYDAFGGFVEVKAPSLDPEDLLAALKAGCFYSSQGPRFLDICVSKTEVSVACTPVQAITLLTGTSRALSRVGRQIAAATFDLTKIDRDVWGKTSAPRWLRIAAIDAAGRRAWSNPIWIDQL